MKKSVNSEKQKVIDYLNSIGEEIRIARKKGKSEDVTFLKKIHPYSMKNLLLAHQFLVDRFGRSLPIGIYKKTAALLKNHQSSNKQTFFHQIESTRKFLESIRALKDKPDNATLNLLLARSFRL